MKFNNGEVIRIKTKEQLNREDIYINSSIKRFLGKELFVRSCNEEKRNCILELPNGNVIINDYGEKMDFNFRYLDTPKDTKLKSLEVGMKLNILDDLKPFTEYGELNTGSNSIKFRGQVVTISFIDKEDNTFKIEEDDKNSWFSRGMTKEYNIAYESIKVGDLVMIIPNLDENRRYDDINVNEDVMIPLRGRIAKITRSWENNTKFNIDLDRGRCVWTTPMFIPIPEGKWVFDINEYVSKNICIKCETDEEVKTLFEVLNNIGIKNGGGNELNAEEFIKIHDKEEYCFEINNEEKLLYCDENYFISKGYKIYSYKQIMFDGHKASMDIPYDRDSSKTITLSELRMRRLHLGDIFYMENKVDENHNGWRIAMNGFSIGLNCKNEKSWSSLGQDMECSITKIIPYDKNLKSRYSKVSEFMSTCNEELIKGIYIRVVG